MQDTAEREDGLHVHKVSVVQGDFVHNKFLQEKKSSGRFLYLMIIMLYTAMTPPAHTEAYRRLSAGSERKEFVPQWFPISRTMR